MIERLSSKFFEYLRYCNFQQMMKDYRYRYDIASDVKFGDNPMPILYGEGVIIIGKGTHIGNGATIMAFRGQCVNIGQNCAISHYLAVYTMNRTAQHANKFEMRGVTIGDNVWIGHSVYINQGITIGEGAVVGAHSVVLQDIPPHCVAVGAPAKVVRRLN